MSRRKRKYASREEYEANVARLRAWFKRRPQGELRANPKAQGTPVVCQRCKHGGERVRGIPTALVKAVGLTLDAQGTVATFVTEGQRYVHQEERACAFFKMRDATVGDVFRRLAEGKAAAEREAATA